MRHVYDDMQGFMSGEYGSLVEASTHLYFYQVLSKSLL